MLQQDANTHDFTEATALKNVLHFAQHWLVLLQIYIWLMEKELIDFQKFLFYFRQILSTMVFCD